MNSSIDPGNPPPADQDKKHLRFHRSQRHLRSVFGDDWLALRAESFARFFGTPAFLIGQSLIVLIWIGLNATGHVSFDVYPFILLNLAFSLQAAYAAPLILLAQTRQAERDRASTEADALHREALASADAERQKLVHVQTERILELLDQNTKLTQLTQEMSGRIESLTSEIHGRVIGNAGS